MADAQLFEDAFTITTIHDDKYERVARVLGTSMDSLTSLSLDLNTELFPVSTGESVSMCLASTLSLSGAKEEPSRGWRPVANEATLADMWDYVCYGKVYRFEEGEGGNIKVYVSFGGLLLMLEGPYKRLSPLRIDQIYMLLKR